MSKTKENAENHLILLDTRIKELESEIENYKIILADYLKKDNKMEASSALVSINALSEEKDEVLLERLSYSSKLQVLEYYD